MAKKEQITLTAEKEYIKYVNDLAKDQFEGNTSMAFRKIVAEHSRVVNHKEIKIE